MTDFVDPYVNRATGILHNLVAATTQEALDQIEADLVEARTIDLPKQPIRWTRDLTELRAIHRYLFADVYDWAGQLRTVDIRKNVEGSEYFVPVSLIERAARFAAGELAEDNFLRGMDRDTFIGRLAHHDDQLNYIHPFRGGNGRTQRAFWDRVCEECRLAVDLALRHRRSQRPRLSGRLRDPGSRAAHRDVRRNRQSAHVADHVPEPHTYGLSGPEPEHRAIGKRSTQDRSAARSSRA